ncbi:hypothetical protein [Longimicrobium sp.]|uniref:hypothetical protein n=1 Tax=Longimicrobium sp. TaxID=2029185 RepID=UPI002B55C089|nr:hypothetical protein [Longimicrobium sp.]HSU13638.1 hypothetical protein [Longimicrobium sp.]
MKAPRRLAITLALGGGAWTCQRAAPAPATPPAASTACAPAEGTLPADARTDALAGDFAVTLVATRGPRTGHAAAGTLRLARYAAGAGPSIEARPDVRYPAHGAASLPLDSVGAEAPGDIAIASASRPGVLAIEQRGGEGTRLMLRFGAEANGAGPQRFDGSYLALYVDALSADRFSGRWSSGVAEREAGGHFCAERVAAR